MTGQNRTTQRRPLVATTVADPDAALLTWLRDYARDRYLATRPAREGFYAKFEREVDPDGTLRPRERAKRAEFARKPQMQRMALKSVQARRRRKGIQRQ